MQVRFIAAAAVALAGAATARGQGASPTPPYPAVLTWINLTATPGNESRVTEAIIASDSRWKQDDIGNLTMVVGTGEPRRLVACGLDHPALIVSDITDDGYIRLRRAGSTPMHPLFDQFYQAQPVRVLTRNGAVAGVVAVDNVHFAQEHRGDTSVVNVDQLWVDVGARSKADAERMGVALIDAVVRDYPTWEYADYVASPAASGSIACGVVALAARAAAAESHFKGQTVFVLSVQSSFAWRGLEAAASRMGRFGAATIVTATPLQSADASAVTRSRVARGTRGMPNIDADTLTRVAVRARFAGSPVESVRLGDVDSLVVAVSASSGLQHSARSSFTDRPRLIPRWTEQTNEQTRDSLRSVASLLELLVTPSGVGNRETPIRDAVRSQLPGWARKIAVQDSAGNLIVAVGPERDTSVFLAHMDEVGYLVRSIDRSGRVTLTPQGGLNGAAWEGQPAYLWADRLGTKLAGTTLNGVFVPRERARLRRPDSLEAWFGVDSAGLVARGVKVGDAITAYKRGERLGDTRFTGRATDDRAGDAALLLALHDIDPAKLRHKLIFVWSVEEELGLNGATAVARRIGTSVHHAYAIDTFVSSDTPLESHVFAYAPLGSGPVLRASDDGMIMTANEQARIESIARDNHIPLQVGTTKGSTDAVPFVARGAIGAQLGWPGRYSHSPAEVLDLNDLRSLARLITVFAQ